jgi:TetR/AcrR family transcriptional regulator
MSGPETTKYANFERIPTEEQQRILDACIEEFAQNDYSSTSTNAIVQRAGIPKGTLFYYFGSKKDLYLYVLDHAMARYVEFFDRTAVDLPLDIFERLLYHGRVRMQFVIEKPRLYQLFFHAFLNAPEEIQAELAPRFAGYTSKSMERLTEGLDLSRFRADVEVDKAIELVSLVLEGIYSRYAPAFKRVSPDEALALVEQIGVEINQYFEILKSGLYI